MANKHALAFEECSPAEQAEILRREEFCKRVAANPHAKRALVLAAVCKDRGWSEWAIYRRQTAWEASGCTRESLLRYVGVWRSNEGHPVNWAKWTPGEIRLVMKLAGRNHIKVGKELHIKQSLISLVLGGRREGPAAQKHADKLCAWASETLSRLAREKALGA